jgi:hypothetical protein
LDCVNNRRSEERATDANRADCSPIVINRTKVANTTATEEVIERLATIAQPEVKAVWIKFVQPDHHSKYKSYPSDNQESYSVLSFPFERIHFFLFSPRGSVTSPGE